MEIKHDDIYIQGNVASLKNSKQMFLNKKTGKMFITSSDLVKTYKKDTSYFWLKNKSNFLKLIKDKEKPLKIGFYFIRKDKRKFDYINIAQLPLDLMQEYGWVEDDDMTNVIPVFIGYEVNKDKAGVVIRVL
ncbi:MAG: hypothetical protein ACRC7W_01075 [Fusobacteriaceae bacterium]